MSLFATISDLDSIEELQPVDDGDYDLEILGLYLKHSSEEKGGQPYISALLSIDGEPTAPPINQMVAYDWNNPDQARSRADLKKFAYAFGLKPQWEAILTELEETGEAPSAKGFTARNVRVKKAVNKRSGVEENSVTRYATV